MPVIRRSPSMVINTLPAARNRSQTSLDAGYRSRKQTPQAQTSEPEPADVDRLLSPVAVMGSATDVGQRRLTIAGFRRMLPVA